MVSTMTPQDFIAKWGPGGAVLAMLNWLGVSGLQY